MAVTPTGRERPAIAAEAFLRALADHGVDYFFCNPGTDFPPIVEAFGRARKTNAKVPKPVLVPHENLAVSMAHGAYLMTGRPQAVMVHVNVGTANTINNLTNLVARPRAAAARGRPHADHREGFLRLALAPDPLGAGNVRPGRHAARTGEVGLRIAPAATRSATWWRAPSRSRWRTRAGRSIWCCRASRCRRLLPSRSARCSRAPHWQRLRIPIRQPIATLGRMDRSGRASADHRRHAAGRSGGAACASRRTLRHPRRHA